LQDATDDGMYALYGAQAGTGAHEDVLVMASHTTSHMDALVHVYERHQHYNGVGHDTMHALTGAQRLGIEKVGAIAGRAVLLDMVRYFGDERHVELGRNITGADLAGAAEAAAVEVRAGDIVLVRTGYLDAWFEAHASRQPAPMLQPGIGIDGARWLVERDIVAVGCDNAAVECIPFDGNDFLAVHKLLLVQHGIYMLEFLDLSAPAADGVAQGLIAVGPLKVTGATGSPVNPVLIA
jgi:kynurenine formamidase